MCHVCTNEPYGRPIKREDLVVVKKHYKEIPENFLDDVFEAITDYHTPQPAVLVVMAEIFDRVRKKDNGIYNWPVIPFSALDLDTWERVQTKEMLAFHTVFESMALAQRNIELVRNVFNKYKYEFFMFCDCGCGGASYNMNERVIDSENYKKINAVRSEIEAIGTDVILADSFDDKVWTERKLDMSNSEINSYKKMWNILCDLSGKKEGFSVQTIEGMNFLKEVGAMSVGQKK